MANKDYDDLLRSFMNNSSKAYDEDRHAVEKQAQQAPVQRTAAADRAARADRLAAEMGKGGPCAGNFAVALGLLEDARCVPVLRALLRAPGPANDPTGPGIYPNRLKAIPLLARFGDRESVHLLRAICADGAQALTADIPARTGIFASPAVWRAEALAWVGTALARLER